MSRGSRCTNQYPPYSSTLCGRKVLAFLDRISFSQELDRHTYVLRDGDHVQIFDSNGVLRDEPEAGTPGGRQAIEGDRGFVEDWETGYYGLPEIDMLPPFSPAGSHVSKEQSPARSLEGDPPPRNDTMLFRATAAAW